MGFRGWRAGRGPGAPGDSAARTAPRGRAPARRTPPARHPRAAAGRPGRRYGRGSRRSRQNEPGEDAPVLLLPHRRPRNVQTAYALYWKALSEYADYSMSGEACQTATNILDNIYQLY